MPTPFQVEAWTEYAVGMLVLLIRIVYRASIVGTDWEGDDYFAVIAVLFWTGELSMLELIGQNGSITGMNDEIALTLSDRQKERIIIGSKCLVAGWMLYVTLIWCLKACMLFLYRRLTLNLQQQKMVLITAVACVLCYVATMLVIATRCLPFHKNWQIYPYPGARTDIMILYIPLPLLWSVRMPLGRKIMCTMWLCTGVFVIVATLLRCILCLKDAKSINLGTIWSIRETFVGILAVNAPVLGPWIAKNASAVRSRASKNRSSGNDPDSANHIVTIGAKDSAHRLERLGKDGRALRGLGWTEIGNDSEERIIETQNDASVSANRSDETVGDNDAAIRVKTTEVSGLA
ncbi:hypothetical protein CTA2_9541 [Colletotrichum tanaceti]|uniref:Rhodopsin domain-containing protein n=1 Tax=Colletotrichum tanaceti TaxID=1306861 RepID=A0A4V6DFM5_9PEZI|nr:hypothetical protein CTA2_9541 [Colletotrichum tanaceti]TKW48736.1 hypothetical protein CTA1_11806 [Colletotrichum tanaceti]